MAQTPLEQTINLADWEFTDPSDIQYIAIDLFNSKKGKQLLIYDMQNTLPKSIIAEKPTSAPLPLLNKLSSLPPLHKALWVWETDKILNHPDEQDQFISFCKKEKFTDIYFQIPYKSQKEKEDWKVKWDDSKIKIFIRRTHLANMKVYALDGDPKFALKKWHPQVLNLVESVIEYNHEVSKIERFDGIHFDIEPYSLPNFFSKKKKIILAEYLHLLKKTHALTRKNNLIFGVDIPTWFDRTDENLKPIAKLEGRPMSEWILDTVDQLTLMDYRTQAEGAHGIIQEAVNEIKYAEKVGKKVFIGLETNKTYDDITLSFIPTSQRTKTQNPLYFSQLVLHKTDAAMVKLQWIPFSHRMNVSQQEGSWHFIQHDQEITAANSISFAGKTRKDLQEAILKTASTLIEFKSFAGFGIHSYESYRNWNQ